MTSFKAKLQCTILTSQKIKSAIGPYGSGNQQV